MMQKKGFFKRDLKKPGTKHSGAKGFFKRDLKKPGTKHSEVKRFFDEAEKALNSRTRMKGFVHAIEGIIAALILLTYLATIDFQPIEKADWSSNVLKQTGSEYLNSFNRANLSKMIYEENSASAAELNRYFFAGTRVSMTSENIPKQKIRVGIIPNYTGDPLMRFSAAPSPEANCIASGWVSEYSCIINGSASNPLGISIILSDTDGGTPNARLDYDAVYADLNGNGIYDPNEGPFSENSVFQTGGTFYSVSNINNATRSAIILNASMTVRFMSSVLPVSINGRNITFDFVTAFPQKSLSQFDAIVIVGNQNIYAYESLLREALQQGKGIVEISDITNSNFNNAQKSIFGFEKVDYTVIGNSNSAKFDRNITLLDPSGPREYFAGTPMKIDIPTRIEDVAGYDAGALPSPGYVRLGVFNTSGALQNVALANSTQEYDSFFIDSNNDKNFSMPSSDSDVYRAGDMFDISGNTYFISKIDASGKYIAVRPFSNHTFLNLDNKAGVFLWNAGGLAVLKQGNYYNISTNSLGTYFSVNFSALPVRGNSANLPAGQHTYAQLNQTNGNFGLFAFNVSLTNSTGKYDRINIDLGYGSYTTMYRNFGEGPFSDGDTIAIWPEKYQVDISSDGTYASFKLIERQAVPASVANYLYSGRTVWMQDLTVFGQDSWNYVRAAVLWASDKKPASENTRSATDIVSVRSVFVSSGDMYLPYEVSAQLGHWG